MENQNFMMGMIENQNFIVEDDLNCHFMMADGRKLTFFGGG